MALEKKPLSPLRFSPQQNRATIGPSRLSNLQPPGLFCGSIFGAAPTGCTLTGFNAIFTHTAYFDHILQWPAGPNLQHPRPNAFHGAAGLRHFSVYTGHGSAL